MSNPRPGLRLMCVHAHPDDESSKGAPVMAKYVDQGHEVLVVTCTGGERGDVLNPALVGDPRITRDLVQVRRGEMRAAQAILGVQHSWLGFVDSGLPEGDPLPPLPEGCFALEPIGVSTEALVREIRSFRPHVMTTYDENGGYPHPDHIRCHEVSMAAFAAAGDAAAYPNAGPAWQPLKIYYNLTFSKERLQAYQDAIVAAGGESPYREWLANWDSSRDRLRTTRVECAQWFERRDQALLAHASQVDPAGNFFKLSQEDQARVWPWEDFEAAMSYVPIAADEDDLFAGIPPEVMLADALATSPGLVLAHDQRQERHP